MACVVAFYSMSSKSDGLTCQVIVCYVFPSKKDFFVVGCSIHDFVFGRARTAGHWKKQTVAGETYSVERLPVVQVRR